MERSINIDIALTPEELAVEFCNMDGDQQAEFFSQIHLIVKRDWDMPFCFQLQSVTESKNLTKGGRSIMAEIGEYSISEELKYP